MTFIAVPLQPSHDVRKPLFAVLFVSGVGLISACLSLQSRHWSSRRRSTPPPVIFVLASLGGGGEGRQSIFTAGPVSQSQSHLGRGTRAASQRGRPGGCCRVAQGGRAGATWISWGPSHLARNNRPGNQTREAPIRDPRFSPKIAVPSQSAPAQGPP